MDKNQLISKLNHKAPGAVLESRRFGRSNRLSIWIEGQSIQKVAAVLKEDPDLELNWLENFSVVELEATLILSYFVNSLSKGDSLVVRASLVPPDPERSVLFPSVRQIWTMGAPMEDEADELFGIRFWLESPDQVISKKGCLPPGWKGFPLRKDYHFPVEFYGISHVRKQEKSPL